VVGEVDAGETGADDEQVERMLLRSGDSSPAKFGPAADGARYADTP
jgi:hypothetical protein